MERKELYFREEMLEALDIGTAQFIKLQKQYLIPEIHFRRELTGRNIYTHEALEILLARNTKRGPKGKP